MDTHHPSTVSVMLKRNKGVLSGLRAMSRVKG